MDEMYWEKTRRCPECLSGDVDRDKFRGRKWNKLWRCSKCHYRGTEKEFVVE